MGSKLIKSLAHDHGIVHISDEQFFATKAIIQSMKEINLIGGQSGRQHPALFSRHRINDKNIHGFPYGKPLCSHNPAL
jgi:hypothetical protein